MWQAVGFPRAWPVLRHSKHLSICQCRTGSGPALGCLQSPRPWQGLRSAHRDRAEACSDRTASTGPEDGYHVDPNAVTRWLSKPHHLRQSGLKFEVETGMCSLCLWPHAKGGTKFHLSLKEFLYQATLQFGELIGANCHQNHFQGCFSAESQTLSRP